MNKVKEIKQNARVADSNIYVFTEQELQLYADEQNREEMIEFALFAIYEYNAGNNVRSADIKNLYDYWKSNQGGKVSGKTILEDPPGYNDEAFKPKGNLKF